MGKEGEEKWNFYTMHRFTCDKCRERFSVLETPKERKMHAETIPCPGCNTGHTLSLSGIIVAVRRENQF